MPKGRQPMKLDGETPEQSFKRLAEPRLARAVQTLESIRALAGAGHTKEQASKVLDLLNGQVAEIKKQYENPPKPELKEVLKRNFL